MIQNPFFSSSVSFVSLWRIPPFVSFMAIPTLDEGGAD